MLALVDTGHFTGSVFRVLVLNLRVKEPVVLNELVNGPLSVLFEFVEDRCGVISDETIS